MVDLQVGEEEDRAGPNEVREFSIRSDGREFGLLDLHRRGRKFANLLSQEVPSLLIKVRVEEGEGDGVL